MRYRTRLAENQSKKFIKRRLTKGLFSSILIVIILATWTFSFIRFSTLESLIIGNFDIIGADQELIAKIEEAADQSLTGKILGIIPRANAYLFSADQVTAAVFEASPLIDSVSVYRRDGRTLTIVVKEKIPQALICPGLPDFSDDGSMFESTDGCYFADSSGQIFNLATSTDIRLNRYYLDTLSEASSSMTAIPLEIPVLKKSFGELQKFYDGAEESGLFVWAILIKEDGEYEMYIRENDISDGHFDLTVVYFNDSRSFGEQLSNLVSFLVKVKGPFEYLDIRYGSNVFYRKMP